MSPMTKIYDVPTGDAARSVDVSEETIKRYARDGKVPARKTVSGRWMFNQADLDDLAIHSVIADA